MGDQRLAGNQLVNRLEHDLTTMGRGRTERTPRGRGLTTERSRDMLNKSKQQFVATARWRSTSKTFLVVARDEDEAQIKAERSKEARGCFQVTITGRYPSPPMDSS